MSFESICIKYKNYVSSVSVIGLVVAGSAASVHAQQTEEVVKFDIPAQKLSNALKSYGVAADRQVLFAVNLVRGKQANAVLGELQPDAALEQLLIGSGLAYEATASDVVIIKTAQQDAPVAQTLRLAPNEAEGADSVTVSEEESDVLQELEEIIVTGTNIRGVENPTTPVIQFDREDIDLSGVATVQDFVRLIPQNFGSTTPLTNNSGNPFNSPSLTEATSIDLRGLGPGSTLTLLNGRRLSLSGIGNFFDVSSLPVSIIERVDVLTDSASAIYGSDAVGGVVNFVTRRDFSGLEARARYGTVTSGNMAESQIGGTGGFRWGSGGGFISAEYTDVKSLKAADRDYVDLTTTFPDATLFPKQETFNLFGSLDQQIADRLSLTADALFTNRDTERNSFRPTRDQIFRGNRETIFVNVGLDYEINDDLTVSLFFDYGDEALETRGSDDDFADFTLYDNDVSIVEGQISGSVFELPAGRVTAALGVSYRNEGYERVGRMMGDRDVHAAYGEVLIPLIGGNQSIPLIQDLTFSAAVRYEDYSDFGDTFNPKIGLFWRLNHDLSLRGSYSEAFRAPTVATTLADTGYFFFPFSDPGLDPAQQDPRVPDGETLFLFFFGTDANVQPETAEGWTAGAEWTPGFAPGLRVEAGLFDVSYTDRLQDVDLFDPILFEDFAILLDRTPDPAFLGDLFARFSTGELELLNFTPIADPTADDVQFLVNSGLQNLSTLDVRGLDFSANYDFEAGVNVFNASFAASYLLDYEIQVTPTSAPFSARDEVYRPVDLRMRGTLSWSRDRLTAYAALNHVGGYTDNQIGNNNASIDAWTTVDLTLAYDTGGRFDAAWANGAVFSISVQNLLDEEPPFVSTGDGLNFDTANASPLGRFISFQMTMSW